MPCTPFHVLLLAQLFSTCVGAYLFLMLRPFSPAMDKTGCSYLILRETRWSGALGSYFFPSVSSWSRMTLFIFPVIAFFFSLILNCTFPLPICSSFFLHFFSKFLKIDGETKFFNFLTTPHEEGL